MTLPKLKSPYYPVYLKGIDSTVRIRPFTVAEEKILLMAMQDKDDTNFILKSLYDALDACIEGDEVKASKLPTFDIEYLFIQLRAKSVSSKATIKFEEDGEIVEASVDLNNVVVSFSEGHTNKIVLDDTYVMTMKYPTFEDVALSDKTEMSNDPMKVIGRTIDKLVNVETDEVLDIKSYSDTEIQEFIDSFSMNNLKDIQNFFNTMPSVKVDAEYITKEGQKKTKEIVGLVSFFTL